ncbi:MAG: hypothetical protein B7X99_03520 [Rhizobiales bacterium 17-65-6]|nr:MAG: hypothetical protein B7X99_03520 [Rhizobiales bacterium 17-65-6]
MGFETQRSVRAGPNPRIGALGFRPFGLTSVLAEGRSFSVHEQVTGHLPFAQMRRFTRSGPAAQAGRALVVAPLAGAFPYLMRDLVAGLLGLVADVTVTDWPDARHVPVSCGRFGFDENVLETAALMQALAGEGPLHVVGICQGVMPALCAALLLAQDHQEGHAPASLSLLGGPVDAGRNPTRLDRMLAGPPEALEGLLEVVPPVFAGGGRRVFPRRRQMQAFALYLWRQGLSGAGLPLRMLLDEGSDPLRFPLARLCWDMMDIPAEFFLGNVEQVFRRRALATGGLAIAGRALDAFDDVTVEEGCCQLSLVVPESKGKTRLPDEQQISEIVEASVRCWGGRNSEPADLLEHSHHVIANRGRVFDDMALVTYDNGEFSLKNQLPGMFECFGGASPGPLHGFGSTNNIEAIIVFFDQYIGFGIGGLIGFFVRLSFFGVKLRYVFGGKSWRCRCPSSSRRTRVRPSVPEFDLLAQLKLFIVKSLRVVYASEQAPHASLICCNEERKAGALILGI